MDQEYMDMLEYYKVDIAQSHNYHRQFQLRYEYGVVVHHHMSYRKCSIQTMDQEYIHLDMLEYCKVGIVQSHN
jgi:hypothetical protein